tara:strand:+ start:233 stop:3067 length:2835 start_codon:yes stop_codon:yes gene_type:complete
MQSSKKNTYVFIDILRPTSQAVRRSRAAAAMVQYKMSDTFRETIGKHWVASIGDLKYGVPGALENFETNNHLKISYDKVTTRLLRDPPFASKQQRICFIGDEEWWGQQGGNYEDWLALLYGLAPLQAGRLSDYSFRIDTPFNQLERKKIGDVSGLGFVDVDFKYNYNNSEYEESIVSIREEYLPNLYAFISDDISRNMRNLKTLQGRIEKQKAQIRSTVRRKAQAYESVFTGADSPSYFHLVSYAYKKAKARFMKDFYLRFKNFIVPFENLDLISDTNMKESFPMFVEVKFSTDSVTEVAQILEDASLSTSLQRHVAAGCGGMNASLLSLMGGGTTNFYVTKQNLSYFADKNGGVTSQIGNFKHLDLMVWWKRYMQGLIPPVYADQTFVGPNTRSVYISSGVQQNNLSQALSLLIFSGKLRDIVKDKTRSIEEIIEGKPCHTETVVYRVAKYKGRPENSQPIQNYWFPNSNNIDVINLVDTQVKYNSTYTYRVFAYQLVIGSEYTYLQWNMAPPQEPEYTQTCPDVQMPELHGAVILDDPVIDVGLAIEDAQRLVETLAVLGVDTTQITNTAMGIVTVYLYSGQFASLKNFLYFAEVIRYVANEYGFDFADLSRSVLNVVNNYRVGEIDSISVPAQIQQLPIRHQYKACLDAISYPSVKLVEVPFFTHTGRMVDSPPLPPDVNIVPYRGENGKALIWLNSTVGEQEMYPIPIYQSDRKLINDIRRDKFLSPTDKITYRSDDNASAFEILRLSVRPEKYSDFANNQRAYLTTQIEAESFERASSASMVDDVLPNQKYYYTFRTVDVHGNRSNPTKVYEIQLVDNDGAVYMITNIIDLEEIPEPYDPVRQAKRYVHIVPRVTQGLFNATKSNLEDAESALEVRSYALGVEDESLWGKKFKVRFISKSTGRKIDLNVTYKRRHEVTSEEKHLRKTVASEPETLELLG